MKGKGTQMFKKAAVILLALGMVGGVSAHGQERDSLARFEGGIGVIPVTGGAGPVNADGTFPNVKLNIVRGVSPAGPWRIADLRAETSRTVGFRSAGAACFWPAAMASARTPTDVFATLTWNLGSLPRAQLLDRRALAPNGDFRIDAPGVPATGAPARCS
jgi:hypothetical protein